MLNFLVDPGKVQLCTRGNCLASENLLESEREEAYETGMYSRYNYDLV